VHNQRGERCLCCLDVLLPASGKVLLSRGHLARAIDLSHEI